jgi:hypothetical protein
MLHAKSDAKMIGMYKSYIELKFIALSRSFRGSLICQFSVLMNFGRLSVPSASKKDIIWPQISAFC